MAEHVAFLRGINVGKRKASKEQLQVAFERLGFGDVSTFRASGNVLFEAGSGRPKPEEIEAELVSELGFQVTVFLRSAKQVAAVAALEPFSRAQLSASRGKLQVSFLMRRPAKTVRAKALELATTDDRLVLDGSELYWLPKGGTQDSGLDSKALERLLGTFTMRTKGTVELIAERLSG